MAANKLILQSAEFARDSVTSSQKKYISTLYTRWAKEASSTIRSYKGISASSEQNYKKQAKEIERMLRASSAQLTKEIKEGITSSLYIVADVVVAANNKWLASLGYNIGAVSFAFNNVPVNVVSNLVTGNLYQGGWSLNSAIWGSEQKNLSYIYEAVAGGFAQNKSILEISQDIEKWVNPNKVTPWNLTMADGKKLYPYQIDYNSQRLARTLAQHSYQQSFIAVTEDNPLITDYIWDANGSRPCPICIARDGLHFKKNELPLDHPNGMCTMIPNVTGNINDKLVEWFNSPDGTFPEMDNFASKLGYTPNVNFERLLKLPNGKFPKSFDNWMDNISDDNMEQLAKQLGFENETSLGDRFYNAAEMFYKTNSKTGAKILKDTPVDMLSFDKKLWLDSLDHNDLDVMDKWTDDFTKLINVDEKEAIRAYTGRGFESMNKFLRGLDDSTEYMKEIDNVKNALGKARLPQDTIVRRGIGNDGAAALLGRKNITTIAKSSDKYVGKLVQDNGFFSTSALNGGGLSGDIELIINLPKDSEAMFISNISNYRTEEEVLVNAGSLFIVESIEVEKDTITRIFLSLVK